MNLSLVSSLMAWFRPGGRGESAVRSICLMLAGLALLTGFVPFHGVASEPMEDTSETLRRGLWTDKPSRLISFVQERFSLDISRRPSEADLVMPATAFRSEVGSVSVRDLVRELPWADEDFMTRLLAKSGLLHKGAIAVGSLRIAYGEIFRPDAVIELGRTGTRWQEPSYLQFKTCFRF